MEIWDLYDENRKPLNKTIERGNNLGDNEYRLTVHVCIFNNKNEMLIQQRQSFKKGWPNAWDISLGGCVVTGENTKEAAQREVFEELGLKVDFSTMRPYFTINFDGGFDDYYFLNKNVQVKDLKLQYSEVQAAKWASLDEILRMIDNKQFIPYYKSFIMALFEMKVKRGVHNPLV